VLAFRLDNPTADSLPTESSKEQNDLRSPVISMPGSSWNAEPTNLRMPGRGRYYNLTPQHDNKSPTTSALLRQILHQHDPGRLRLSISFDKQHGVGISHVENFLLRLAGACI
jgi:hypothetical protein